MDLIPHITRQLWIAPPDLFKAASADTIGTTLEQMFNCDVWLLSDNGGMAFSPKGLLLNRGIPIDYPASLEITKPLFKFITQFIATDDTGTHLELPNDRFWVRVWLGLEEPNSRFCVYFKSQLESLEPFAFRAFASNRLTSKNRDMLMHYLEEWHAKYSNVSVHGER